MRRAFVALIVGVAGVAAAAAAAVRPPGPSARLLFAGDVLLARQVAVEMHESGRFPWDSIAPEFAGADWIGANLEGAFGPDSACVHGGETCFAFADSTAQLLARAGFTVLAAENNHAGDLGADGRAHTRAVLRDAGIAAADFAHSPVFTRAGDATVAVVAVSLVRGADGVVETIPSVELDQRLRVARALADLVVVSVHWGTELQDWPSDEQRRAAAWLVDHGADLVVGHHPHVVQKPDCVHGHPVFYSLGNHVFDQRYPVTKTGLIADCALRGGRLRCDAIKTRTRRGSALPAPDGRLRSSALDGCAPVLPSRLRINGFDVRARAWSATDPDSGVTLEGMRGRSVRWRTRRADLVAIQGGLHTNSGDALFTLERHPSPMDGEVALRPHVYRVRAGGLVPLWRGTALAWPLRDAVVDAHGDVCALHRGDSFVQPNPSSTATRTMRYRWNGFGFSAAPRDAALRCDAGVFALPQGAH